MCGRFRECVIISPKSTELIKRFSRAYFSCERDVYDRLCKTDFLSIGIYTLLNKDLFYVQRVAFPHSYFIGILELGVEHCPLDL